MRREATWINIGKDIRTAKSITEALNLSGLDYTVEKKQVYLENGTPVPGQFATVKAGTNDVFGIVGDQYEIVQNADAFNFIDGIIPEGLEFVKAGETHNMTYIIGHSSIEVDPRYSFVIRFVNCTNCVVENLTMGHTEGGFCSGGVIGARQTSNLTVKDCDLYGCGTYGLDLRETYNFKLILQGSPVLEARDVHHLPARGFGCLP